MGIYYFYSGNGQYFFQQDVQWGTQGQNYGFGERAAGQFFAYHSEYANMTQQQRTALYKEARREGETYPLTLSDIRIDGLITQPQVKADALSPQTNPAIFGVMAPDWRPSKNPFQDIASYQWTAGGSGILLPNQAGKITGNQSYAQFVKNANTKNYTMFTLYGEGGPMALRDVHYVSSNGVHRLPNEYWSQVADSAVLVSYEAPEDLTFRLDTYGQGGEFFYSIGQKSGNSVEDLMPPSGFDITTDIQTLKSGQAPVTYGEGIIDGNADIRPGGQLNAQVFLKNGGLKSGELTVRSYIGYTGTVKDAYLGVKKVAVGSMSTNYVMVSGTIPSTSEPYNPILTLDITAADGTHFVSTHTLNRDDLKAEERYPADYSPVELEKLARIGAKNETYIAAGNDPRAENIADNREENPTVVQNPPPNAPVEEPAVVEKELLAENKTTPSGINVGGVSAEVQPPVTMSSAQIFKEVISLYQTAENKVKVGTYYVTTETIIGRIFLGIYKKVRDMDDGAKADMLKKIESVTGLSASTIGGVLSSSSDSQVASRLQDVFKNAGYGHVFLTKSGKLESTVGLYAMTDDDDYKDKNIRVYIDPTMQNGEFIYAKAYLNGSNELVTGTHYKTYIDISPKQLPLSANNLELKIVAGYKGGIQATAVTNEFDVKWDGKMLVGTQNPDVITYEKLSDDPVENAILQRMQIPVEGNGWRYHNESPYHKKGTKDEFAIDINLGIGDSDRGQPVTSSYAGEVVYINKDIGFLILQHTAQIEIAGELKKVTWWTGYMHMENITLEIGEYVENGDYPLGTVGKTGLTNGNTSHLHYAVYVGKSIANEDLKSLNLGKWASANGLSYGT